MKNNFAIKVIAAIVVTVFSLGIWLSGDTVNLTWLRFYSAAVMIATLLFLLWEHWIWRWPLVQRMPKVKRSVRGTWRGEIRSQWVDPATGSPLPVKVVYLVVRQTASAVKVVLHTDESSSTSGVGGVTESDGIWFLDYMYLNTPAMSVEHRSHIHHGSCSVRLVGLPVTRMSGRYWTDRDSKGELVFERRRDTLTDDYRSADSLF